jgi:hypothetical protein
MWRIVALLFVTVATSGSAKSVTSMKALTFLTRDGCPAPLPVDPVVGQNALGATEGEILRSFARQGLGLTVFGLVVGLAAAGAASRLLTTLLYGYRARLLLDRGGRLAHPRRRRRARVSSASSSLSTTSDTRN